MSSSSTAKGKRGSASKRPLTPTDNDTMSKKADLLTNDDRSSGGEGGQPAKRAKVESAIRELKRVHVVTSNINDQIEAVTVVFLNKSFSSAVEARLRKIEMLDDLHRYAINLAKAEPNDYDFTGKGETIIHKTSRKPAHFWMLGTIQHSALFTNGPRSITVNLSDYTFERACAVVGAIKKTDIIFLPTFNKGVSFSTYRTAAPGESNIEAVGVGPSSPSKNRLSQDNRLNVNAPVTLPFDVEVPAFEAYDKMNPNNIRNSRKLTTEPAKNAGVIVGFTIGAYPFKSNKTYTFKSKIIKQALSLNLQFVVVLAGAANPAHLNDKATIRPAYGVGPPLEYDSEDEIIQDNHDVEDEETIEWI